MFLACALAAPSFRFTHPPLAFAGLNGIEIQYLNGIDAASSVSVDLQFDTGELSGILKFLKKYWKVLEFTKHDQRVLVIGKNDFPFVEFFEYGAYRAFGIAHHLFTKRSGRYVQGEYDEMPFRDKSFALLVAPELNMWHVDGSDFMLINDTQMAHELHRILQDGGLFLANLQRLHGFMLHLVHAGFSRMDVQFGNVEVWQKDVPANPSRQMMVREYMQGQEELIKPPKPRKPRGRFPFMRSAGAEINKIEDFVRSVVPGAQIIITSVGEKKIGWERLPFLWNNLAIWIRRPTVYDRTMRSQT